MNALKVMEFAKELHHVLYLIRRIKVFYLCIGEDWDGIISTKSGLIKSAGELGMATVQRFFILDSLSVQSAVRSAAALQPDAIEILPGIMPRIVRTLCREVQVPLIAGGLISSKEDVIQALSAGALGVSTTNPAVWSL